MRESTSLSSRPPPPKKQKPPPMGMGELGQKPSSATGEQYRKRRGRGEGGTRLEHRCISAADERLFHPEGLAQEKLWPGPRRSKKEKDQKRQTKEGGARGHRHKHKEMRRSSQDRETRRLKAQKKKKTPFPFLSFLLLVHDALQRLLQLARLERLCFFWGWVCGDWDWDGKKTGGVSATRKTTTTTRTR